MGQEQGTPNRVGTGAAAFAPVWAPNPAVPLLARVLAYAFAALMLLAVLLTLFRSRPPDTAPAVREWASYHAREGCDIPYPKGWQVQSHTVQDGSGTELLVSLRPGSPVQMVILVADLPVEIGDGVVRQLGEQLAGKRAEQFPDYAEPPAADHDAGLLHSFSFRMPDEPRGEMAGAWTMRYHGRRLLYAHGITPPAGRRNLEEILRHIAQTIPLG